MKKLSTILIHAILFLTPINSYSLSFNELFSRGVKLCQEYKCKEALALFEQLHKMSPSNTAIRYNIAYTLKAMGRVKEAIPLYQKVIAEKPDHEYAHYGLSQAYLATGDYKNGWPEFEWRLVHQSSRVKKSIDPSRFRGKKIVLGAEFGLGDTMQFIRYVKLLKKHGATVIVQTHKPLVPLFSLCDYIDQVIPDGNPLPRADIYMPLLSLPFVFKTTVETVPVDIPYLYADEKLQKVWQKKISDDKNFKIGICWQGKHLDFLDNNPLCTRAVPLSFFSALNTIPGVSLYSLQKTCGMEQLKKLPKNMTIKTFDNFDATNGRYMDTAALMTQLDLIISVDTSVVHLAGALGKPVWILIPYNAAWHWMQKRTDSPWYPTVRLFRQPKPHDWDSVMVTIVQELRKVINEKKQKNISS